VQDAGERRAATELVFLNRGPLLLRAWVVLVAAAGCGLAGVALFRLHQQLLAGLRAGSELNPLQTLIANGSSWRTLWPGWLAALFFLIALRRLRRGPVEPPAGLRSPERLTPAQLRRGLRTEYRLVRAGVVVLGLIAGVDAARAIVYIADGLRSGHAIAASLVPTAAEAAGFVVAAAVLAAWAWTFGADLRRLGAL